MGMIKRLDHTGDSVITAWAPAPEGTDPAKIVSVDEAREIFDALVADPTVGLGQIEDATHNIARKVSKFDPEAKQIIVWRQFAGG